MQYRAFSFNLEKHVLHEIDTLTVDIHTGLLLFDPFCDKGGTLLIISTLVYMDNAIIIILKFLYIHLLKNIDNISTSYS